MGRGGYLGGSTIIKLGSDWFSRSKERKKLTKVQKQKRAKENADLERMRQEKQKQKALEKNLKRREETERRRADPKWLATLAARRRVEDERMKKVVVEIRKPRAIKRMKGVAKD